MLHYGAAELLARRDAEPPDLYGTVSTPAVVATLAAWRDGQHWQDQLLGVLDRNRRRVHEVLAGELPAARHHLPEATHLSWVDMSALGVDDPVERIRRAGVLVDGGAAFGEPGRQFIRINIATSASILERILTGILTGSSSGTTPT